MNSAFKTLLDSVLGGVGAYLVRAPQKSQAPYVVYREISSDINETVQGCEDQQRSLIQVDIYSDKYNDSFQAMIDSVKSLHGSHSGKIHLILFSTEQDFYEQDTKLYRKSIDFDVIYYR